VQLLIVVSTPHGVDSAPARAAGNDIVDQLRSSPHMAQVTSPWTAPPAAAADRVSRDRTSGLIVAGIDGDESQQQKYAKELSDQVAVGHDGVTVRSGETAMVNVQITEQSQRDLGGLVAAAFPEAVGVMAILGARAGLEVVVVERRHGPVDKACGEGLMPHTPRDVAHSRGGSTGQTVSRHHLHRRPAPRDRPVRRRHRARCAQNSAARQAVGRSEGGRCPYRACSDRAGAPERNIVALQRLQARHLAAADGLHSPIRAALGLARQSGGTREAYWSDDREAYVTPVADDRVGIAILTSHKGGFDTHLGAFSALQERVCGQAHGPDRAAGPLRQKVISRTAGRVLLVGDAAGYVDALTGEGLGIAFGAANLLVDCVAADRPADYDRRWRPMSRRYRMLTAAVLQASASPLRSGIVPVAAQFPGVFTRVVNLLAE
jgi:hypothetical protein